MFAYPYRAMSYCQTARHRASHRLEHPGEGNHIGTPPPPLYTPILSAVDSCHVASPCVLSGTTLTLSLHILCNLPSSTTSPWRFPPLWWLCACRPPHSTSPKCTRGWTLGNYYSPFSSPFLSIGTFLLKPSGHLVPIYAPSHQSSHCPHKISGCARLPPTPSHVYPPINSGYKVIVSMCFLILFFHKQKIENFHIYNLIKRMGISSMRLKPVPCSCKSWFHISILNITINNVTEKFSAKINNIVELNPYIIIVQQTQSDPWT